MTLQLFKGDSLNSSKEKRGGGGGGRTETKEERKRKKRVGLCSDFANRIL